MKEVIVQSYEFISYLCNNWVQKKGRELHSCLPPIFNLNLNYEKIYFFYLQRCEFRFESTFCETGKCSGVMNI
jgi:hypothetical protein